MKTGQRSLILGAALVLMTAGLVSAQDNNYWTNAFGMRSDLMGGAVVGGVRDPSAGYYNPGAVPFISDPSITVNANAYKVEMVTVDNATGTGEDFDSNQISIVPLLVAGTFTFEEAPSHFLGWSILTRSDSHVKGSLRTDTVMDVIDNPYFPGDEDFIGQVLAESQLEEYWGGLTYGYKINDSWGIGLTNFLALRNQQIDGTASARAINQYYSTVGSTDTANSIDFWNLRLLWKLGIAGTIGDFKLGFTATSPSASLAGDGTVYRDYTIQNLDLTGSGAINSFVASDRQDGLDATWRSPASFAWGAEYAASDSTKIGVSLEWFLEKDRYNVIMPKSHDFVRPNGALPGFNSDQFLRVAYQADSVVNVGAGLEQALTDKVTGYLGFRTDFSAYKESDAVDYQGFEPGVSNWDIYHITTGAIYRKEHSEFGLGVTYSWGKSDDYMQMANFPTASSENALLGDPEKTDANYSAVSVMLGYSYLF